MLAQFCESHNAPNTLVQYPWYILIWSVRHFLVTHANNPREDLGNAST